MEFAEDDAELRLADGRPGPEELAAEGDERRLLDELIEELPAELKGAAAADGDGGFELAGSGRGAGDSRGHGADAVDAGARRRCGRGLKRIERCRPRGRGGREEQVMSEVYAMSEFGFDAIVERRTAGSAGGG